jgi:hypothetical protein
MGEHAVGPAFREKQLVIDAAGRPKDFESVAELKAIKQEREKP